MVSACYGVCLSTGLNPCATHKPSIGVWPHDAGGSCPSAHSPSRLLVLKTTALKTSRQRTWQTRFVAAHSARIQRGCFRRPQPLKHASVRTRCRISAAAVAVNMVSPRQPLHLAAHGGATHGDEFNDNSVLYRPEARVVATSLPANGTGVADSVDRGVGDCLVVGGQGVAWSHAGHAQAVRAASRSNRTRDL